MPKKAVKAKKSAVKNEKDKDDEIEVEEPKKTTSRSRSAKAKSEEPKEETKTATRKSTRIAKKAEEEKIEVETTAKRGRGASKQASTKNGDEDEQPSKGTTGKKGKVTSKAVTKGKTDEEEDLKPKGKKAPAKKGKAATKKDDDKDNVAITQPAQATTQVQKKAPAKKKTKKKDSGYYYGGFWDSYSESEGSYDSDRDSVSSDYEKPKKFGKKGRTWSHDAEGKRYGGQGKKKTRRNNQVSEIPVDSEVTLSYVNVLCDSGKDYDMYLEEPDKDDPNVKRVRKCMYFIESSSSSKFRSWITRNPHSQPITTLSTSGVR